MTQRVNSPWSNKPNRRLRETYGVSADCTPTLSLWMDYGWAQSSRTGFYLWYRFLYEQTTGDIWTWDFYGKQYFPLSSAIICVICAIYSVHTVFRYWVGLPFVFRNTSILHSTDLSVALPWCSTSSQRCSIGLRSGGRGDLLCSRNQFMAILASWHCGHKRWAWSKTILS